MNALSLKPKGIPKFLISFRLRLKFSGDIQDKIIPSNFLWFILLIISEIFSPLGNLVPSEICAPIK